MLLGTPYLNTHILQNNNAICICLKIVSVSFTLLVHVHLTVGNMQLLVILQMTNVESNRKGEIYVISIKLLVMII
jgi:hypothetical protein